MNKLSGFKEYDLGQSFLIPTSINDYIPANHPARLINMVTKGMDFSKLNEKYCPDVGQNAYDTRMMINILFYALFVKVDSSREINSRLKTDLAFMFLSGRQTPSYRSIARFRVKFFDEIDDFFVQIVKICYQMGLVGLEHLSIDGTKIKANASYKKDIDEKRVKNKIKAILRKGLQTDIDEDKIFDESTPFEIPPEVASNPELNTNIKKALEDLKLLKESNKTKLNKTDPDANIMKNKTLTLPSYNFQGVIDDKHNVMVAACVTQEETDYNQLVPMIGQTISNLGLNPKIVCADAGYFTYDNYEWCKNNEIVALIPDNMYFTETHGRSKYYPKSKFRYNSESDTYTCRGGRTLSFIRFKKDKKGNELRIYRGKCDWCPLSLSCKKGKNRTITRHPQEHLITEMRKRLDSKSGKEAYSKRLTNAEGAFGVMKHNGNWREVKHRGSMKASGECMLHGCVYNLKIIIKQLSLDIVEGTKNGLNSSQINIFDQNYYNFAEKCSILEYYMPPHYNGGYNYESCAC